MKTKSMNIQKAEAIANKDFKEGTKQTIKCDGSITEEILYKGVIKALYSNHAELCIISKTAGLNYFTNLNLMPLFDIIAESVRIAAEEFNSKVRADMAKLNDNVDGTTKA